MLDGVTLLGELVTIEVDEESVLNEEGTGMVEEADRTVEDELDDTEGVVEGERRVGEDVCGIIAEDE